MNLLKSIFITNYMMLAMGLMGYSTWMIFHKASPLPWIGVLLTVGPLMMLISYLMMLKSIARTSANFPIINFLGFLGVVLAVGYNVSQNQFQELQAPVLAVIGYLGFLFYSYWYSAYGRSDSVKIAVGQILPRFEVTNHAGEKVSSQKLTEKPAVLIFYRGNWCPLCMAQIKELVSQYKDIEALGVRVALISPQPHSNTKELAKKFNVPFDFLTDKGNHAGRALGINQNNGLPLGMQVMGYDSETVLPTVIITDKGGKILWKHETDNYRIRPEPSTYLEVLKRNRIGVA